MTSQINHLVLQLWNIGILWKSLCAVARCCGCFMKIENSQDWVNFQCLTHHHYCGMGTGAPGFHHTEPEVGLQTCSAKRRKKTTSWSSCTLRGKLLRRGKAGSQDIPLEEFLAVQQMQEAWVLVGTVERETKDLRFGLAGCHSWSWLLSENRAGNAGVWSQVPMVRLELQFNFDTCWDTNIQKYSDHAWGAAVLPHLRYIDIGKKDHVQKMTSNDMWYIAIT